MKRTILLTAIITVAVLLSTTDWSMAHGKRHAGGHPDARAASCLKPIQKKGLMGIGFWENSCSYGVHVKWRIESEEPGTGCTSRPGNAFPCLTYVGANTRETAPMSDNSGYGSVRWIACRAENFYSDPWPRITKVNPGQSVKYKCFHMGFGPGGKVADKRELEKALRKTHGQLDYSLHQYKEQKLARIEREQEREQARERRQWEEQEREWEREEAELAKELRQRNRAMWNQIGKNLGGLIFKRNESNETSGSGPRGRTLIPCRRNVAGHLDERGVCVPCPAATHHVNERGQCVPD